MTFLTQLWKPAGRLWRWGGVEKVHMGVEWIRGADRGGFSDVHVPVSWSRVRPKVLAHWSICRYSLPWWKWLNL